MSPGQVSAPLQITNALPFEARFVIYEKPSSTGKLVERERGRHLSGEVAHIYSVDLQRPVYITWEIEGWTQKKGPVLLCFGASRAGGEVGRGSRDFEISRSADPSAENQAPML